jgi:hypothetical protein
MSLRDLEPRHLFLSQPCPANSSALSAEKTSSSPWASVSLLMTDTVPAIVLGVALSEIKRLGGLSFCCWGSQKRILNRSQE